MNVVILGVEIIASDKASKAIQTIGDKIRFLGARMRNAGIGMTIAMAPFGIALGGVVNEALNLEKATRSIGQVTVATGRDIDGVMGILNSHTGEMSSKVDIMQGSLKLLSTSLSNTQIDKFIQLVKDGSAAMGEDFGAQMNLVTRGFKQLNPNVIDNIGINVRMKDIYKKVTKEIKSMEAAGKSLSEAQKDAMIEQTLFNEMIRKGSIFTGMYAAQMDTTAGKIMRVKAHTKDLSAELGVALIPFVNQLADGLTSLIKKFNTLPERVKQVTMRIGSLGVAMGLVAAVTLMFGGNAIWAAGQLMKLDSTSKVFLLTMSKLLTVILLTIIAYRIWQSPITGILGKILLLKAAMVEFIASLFHQFGPNIAKVTNWFADLQNAIAGVVNGLVDYTGVGKKIAVMNHVTIQDMTDIANGLMNAGNEYRKQSNVYAKEQKILNQKGVLDTIPGIGLAKDFLSITPQPTPGGGVAGGAVPETNITETNMYGNMTVIEINGLESPDGGSYFDSEKMMSRLASFAEKGSE